MASIDSTSSVSTHQDAVLSVSNYKMRVIKWKTFVLVLLSLIGGASLYHLFGSVDSVQVGRNDKLLPNSDYGGNQMLGGVDRSSFEGGRQLMDDHNVNRESNLGFIDENQFQVSSAFHFPQPHYSKPDSVLLRSDWVNSLKRYLAGIKGKQISFVTSTEEHTDVLINWLISAYLVAKPPLDNILVLSMGKSLHDLLESRGFSSLYITAGMVISPRANITRVFSQVHIVRLNVIRLINHFGFDVVNYDCDAILLKNPQNVFDGKKGPDLIGTFGKGPAHLFRKWGVTLNTGVMLLRANPKIEHYWESMSQLKRPTTDDQGNINLVLDYLQIIWIDFKKSENIDFRKQDIHGIIRVKKPKISMVVSLMSFNTVCRHTCSPEQRNKYYVWHALAIKENRTVENKVSQARVGSAWFLNEHWQQLSEIEPGLKKEEWLRYVTNKEATGQ